MVTAEEVWTIDRTIVLTTDSLVVLVLEMGAVAMKVAEIQTDTAPDVEVLDVRLKHSMYELVIVIGLMAAAVAPPEKGTCSRRFRLAKRCGWRQRRPGRWGPKGREGQGGHVPGDGDGRGSRGRPGDDAGSCDHLRCGDGIFPASAATPAADPRAAICTTTGAGAVGRSVELLDFVAGFGMDSMDLSRASRRGDALNCLDSANLHVLADCSPVSHCPRN